MATPKNPTNSQKRAREVPVRKRETKTDQLKPHLFKPGQSGNPAGKPVGAKDGLRAKLRRQLEKNMTPAVIRHYKQQGIFLSEADFAGAMAERLCQIALSGDITAIRTIFEQTEKPLKQTIGLEGGEDNSPVQFIMPPNPLLEKPKPKKKGKS